MLTLHHFKHSRSGNTSLRRVRMPRLMSRLKILSKHMTCHDTALLRRFCYGMMTMTQNAYNSLKEVIDDRCERPARCPRSLLKVHD
jgi:hypothetical protein